MIKNIDFDDGKLDNFYELISKNVIRIRKERKISQLKLANAIGHQSPTFLRSFSHNPKESIIKSMVKHQV